jgi:FkbM family methyltransferase
VVAALPQHPVIQRSRFDPQTTVGKVAAVVRRAARVSGLGARPADRARLFAGAFYLLVSAKTPRRGRDRLRVTIRAFGRHGRATISDYSHILLLEAIFLDGDYAIEPRTSPHTIVDLGSNIGLSLLYFRLRFPEAHLIGVEPDPQAFALLQRNAPGVTLHHAAVGEHDGTATFWSAPGAVASSLHRTHDAQQPVEVPVRTLDTLVEAHIDILKLVVEGSEFAALSGDLRRIDAITGEILLKEGEQERLREVLKDFDLDLHEDKGDGFWQFHALRREAP